MTSFYIISLKANFKKCLLTNFLNLLVTGASLILRGRVLHNVDVGTSNGWILPSKNEQNATSEQRKAVKGVIPYLSNYRDGSVWNCLEFDKFLSSKDKGYYKSLRC